MNAHPLSRSAYQIQTYVQAVNAELEHIQAALFRLRSCTALLLSASDPMSPEAGTLDRMYEDLERAIKQTAPGCLAPVRHAAEPAQSPIGAQAYPDSGRSRVVRLKVPSAHAKPDNGLQVVTAPARAATTTPVNR